MVHVGQTIKIIQIEDRPHLNGLTGKVTAIDFGNGFIYGTWSDEPIRDDDAYQVIDSPATAMLDRIQDGYCPKCGGENAFCDDTDYDIAFMMHKWYCTDCGATWETYEIVKFAGFAMDGVEYSANGEVI